jgi:hypothetical protein
MGSQQLLLIVVGMVLIGIAIAVGMTMFADQAISANRDEVANDLTHFGAMVRSYYRKPTSFGGGGMSFKGLTMARITSKPSNDNGTYSLTPDPVSGNPAFVTLIGIGTQEGLDGTSNVKVVMLVYPDSIKIDDSQIN